MLPSNLFSPACALSLSCARLFVTPWTIACQPPQTMGFSRQENWMGCHFLLQGIFLTQGPKLRLLYWHADSFPLSHLGSPFSPAPSPLCHSTPAFWASLGAQPSLVRSINRAFLLALSTLPTNFLLLLPSLTSFMSLLKSCPSQEGLHLPSYQKLYVPPSPPNSYSLFQPLFCLSTFRICLYLIHLFIICLAH